MNETTTGLRGAGEAFVPAGFDPAAPGPLDRRTALGLLQRADTELEASEAERALALYARVMGMADHDVSAAALYGMGNALYRLDRDEEALQAWEQATQIGESPVTYRAWRQVAAARVRAGDMSGALAAYRECERRAPPADRAEIASRLGWLSKETGNRGAAGRYFARSRGDALPPFLTYLTIAVTVVISFTAMGRDPNAAALFNDLALDKAAVAGGEYWRLFTVTLVHDPSNILHLLFNMYALYYAGTIVERMYGAPLFGLFYLLCALAGSVASFVFGSDAPSVGASGAIFGLFGVILVAQRIHHPVLDRRSRAVAGQIGFLIAVNLVLQFVIPNVDYFAHIGGLLAGLWLGFLIPPGKVQTLGRLWQSPRVANGANLLLVRGLGVAALAVVIVVGVVVGTDARRNPQPQSGGAAAVVLLLPAGGAVALPRLVAGTRRRGRLGRPGARRGRP